MKFAENIFGAYDIRGKVPNELTPEVAKNIGRAMADYVPAGQIALGRDMRPDSERLAQSVIEGLIMQGREVVDLGQITSDMMYFAVGNYGFAGGAMITASHNPGEYNGLKLTNKGVMPIAGDQGLLQIKKALIEDRYKDTSSKGSVTRKNILSDWVDHALSFAPGIKPLHVGFDAGNGMAGIIPPELSKKSPLKIEGLYLELDGTFPNHMANPLIDENLTDLIKLIKDKSLDCGVAFDADGDRGFLVDERGVPLTGSVLGALLITQILQEKPGSTILYNAICSRIVPETIEKLGGKGIRTRVGHGFIKADMHKYGAVFACEHSGHFYFKDNYNADSGLIPVLMGLSILSKSDKKLSEVVQAFRSTYVESGEINFEVADKKLVMEKIARAYADGKHDNLDGLTVNYPDWWFNVRPSQNEPLLRLNIEAKQQAMLDANLKKITEIIKTNS
jgi:phosphomannomutase